MHARLRRPASRAAALAAAAAALACAAPLQAKTAPRLEVDASSVGGGVGVVAPLARGSDLRLIYDGVDLGGYRLTTRTSDTLAPAGGTPIGARLAFDDTFHPRSVSLIYDRHLRASPLYLSAGAVVDLNRIDAVSRPEESVFTYNGATYQGTAFGAIAVRVRWNPLAPYVGVGLQRQATAARPHAGARVEIGALFQGSRRVSVEPSGLVAANPAVFGAYVDAFAAAVPSHVPALGVYPVARLSVPLGR